MPNNLSYGKSILIAIDQLINALLGGWPDETLSSRAYRLSVAGRCNFLRICIDWIASLFNDKNHCEESFRSERLGKQLPPEARK